MPNYFKYILGAYLGQKESIALNFWIHWLSQIIIPNEKFVKINISI